MDVGWNLGPTMPLGLSRNRIDPDQGKTTELRLTKFIYRTPAIAMDTRTTELSPQDLEGNIAVLSSAAQALQLTRFEKISYRALMVSAYVITGSVAFQMIFGLVLGLLGKGELLSKWASPMALEFHASVLLGILSLALNIPLFIKAFRERARLKKLGLGSLSESLWKESRRRRWKSRILEGLLIVGGTSTFLVASLYLFFLIFRHKYSDLGIFKNYSEQEILTLWLLGVLYLAIITALLFSARYLHSQRERMDLTANAQQLKKVLERLQQRIGKAEVASVPSALLEQTAKIESAQIAKERKDALLQSVAFRSSGYAIAFDRDAAERRATLSIADRVELEDLVAQLSTEGAQLGSQPGAVDGSQGATIRGTTKSKRIEIEFAVDQASRAIRITNVRHGEDGSDSPLKGGSHA
jgi:hypothetical protein